MVSGLVEVKRPWDRTVDSRSKIASAPLSRRAELLVLATHADSGPDSSSQEDSLSRFSPVMLESESLELRSSPRLLPYRDLP